MFTPERDVWLTNMPSLNKRNISIPGLSPIFPHVHCQRSGEVCLVATGVSHAHDLSQQPYTDRCLFADSQEGQINAAASTTALFLSERFDLRKTYMLVAGIGGVNPNVGTLGSVVFARYAVQASQQYALDAREVSVAHPARCKLARSLQADAPRIDAGQLDLLVLELQHQGA